ncbi:hypothetical protein Z517_07754 [Fonsecaea pedrosoi CBS 271.37]|uniref:Uncharacterized protein n=1 Tax=Fonsecaea pedrosoi CBS 271.37 TaxID=1442368 RepID=A0A0D2DJV9_9EURO|nr:uncharacterized protein Z517_07754 [Fonsecaea pedrosoi CBS 271.37]KIW77921.1 hypothetical protein Z517_07754 [Fonsecaea pedrosoi CBS 271.37]
MREFQYGILEREWIRGNLAIMRPTFDGERSLRQARRFITQENHRDRLPVDMGGYPASYEGRSRVRTRLNDEDEQLVRDAVRDDEEQARGAGAPFEPHEAADQAAIRRAV